MDCREDSDFHVSRDDNSRAVGKAKESILLMKKKMFRSHDLILQYNNKLKECDRLKEDLCTAQEEGSKLKRENSINLLKVGKLESQIEERKKSQLEFEQKIADQEIRIASDKCHVQQLICKLESIESKHSEEMMEIDLQKSSMEVKIKELEQELKRLNKSHQVQMPKLEKTMNCPKVKKAATKKKMVEKETNDVGINTVMAKPNTVDKSILTDEFYHMKDNPYPIFCDRCESLTSPNVEKICKIMTGHPPLLSEMLSPPQLRVSEKRRDHNGPLEPIVSQCPQEPPENVTNAIGPEIDSLKRKLATLERKIKKRKKENSRESQPPHGNCCGHARPPNCCNHASSTAPNVQTPNVQPDFMAEFWNRIMQFTNGTLSKQNTSRVQRKNSTKTQLLKLKKQKMMMSVKKRSNHSSINWEIESVDCPSEIETTMDNDVETNSGKLHILRLKPSEDTDILPAKGRKKSTGKTRASSSIHVDEFTERDNEIANESSHESPIKICKKSKGSNALLFDDDAEIENSSTKSTEVIAKADNSQVSQRRSSSRIQERKQLRSREIEVKKLLYTSEYLSASSNVDLDDQEVTRSSRKSAAKSRKISSESESRGTESAYETQNSAINESSSIYENSKHVESSVGIVRSSTNDRSPSGSKNMDSTSANDSNVTQNSTNNHSNSEISTSHNLSQQDEGLSDAPLEHYSDSETSKCTRSFLVPERTTRKRKRANSLKATKRTSRSKLLGKLRALKKNSIEIATKGNPSIINEIPLESGTENAAIATGNDSAVIVPTAKKQRIAHVPKPASANESDIVQENDVTEDKKKYHKNRSKYTKNEEKTANARLNVSAETLTETNCADDIEAKMSKLSVVRRTSLPTNTEHLDESDRSKLSMESASSSKTLARTKATDIDGLRAELSENSDGSKLSSMELTPNLATGSEAKSVIIDGLKSEHSDESNGSKLLPNDPAPNLANIASAKSTIMGGVRAEHLDDCDGSKLLSIDSASNLATIASAKSTIISDVQAEHLDDSDGSKLLSIESASNLATIASAKSTIISDVQAEHLDDSDGSKLLSVDSTPNSATITSAKSTIMGDVQAENLNDSGGSKLLPIDSAPNLATTASVKSTIMSDLRDKPSDDSDSPKLSSMDLAPTLATISRAKGPIIGELRSEYSKDPDELKLSPIESIPSSTTFPMAKTAIIGGLPTETPKQPDSHSISPALLPASLHRLPMTSRILPVLPMPTRVPRPIKRTHKMISDKTELSNMIKFNQSSFTAKTSLLTTPETPKSEEASTSLSSNSILSEGTNEISTCTNFSLDTTNTIISISSTTTKVEQDESQGDAIHFSFGDEASRAAPHEQTLALPDESPASPDASVFSNDPLPADWPFTEDSTLQPNKVQRHLSIYDQVELPIAENIPTASTPSDIVTTQTVKTERIPLTYDTSLFGNHEGESEDNKNFDSPTISNSSSFFNETHDRIKKNERKNNRSGNLQNVLKDLRTRKVQCFTESVASQQNTEKIYGPSHEDGKSAALIDAATYQRGIRSLNTLLGRHLAEVKKKSSTKGSKLRRAAATKLQIEAEKVVKNELDKLVDSEIWSSALQTDVIAKLRQASSPKTLAKSIVDFLIERANLDEPLDRSYTPPAPIMTRTQQRIATLISGIERDGTISGVFEFVMAGINYNLFKIGCQNQVDVLEQLARMFTVLARIKKDRARVRIMCCDAFYFLGRKVCSVMYVVLTIWPEVFPMHNSQMDPLLNAMVHLLRADESPKSMALKNMLKGYYKYPDRQIQTTVLMAEWMNELKTKTTGELEAAILIVAKREGVLWTYKNVVDAGLLKVVSEPSYPSIFNALTLLGFLVRVFPIEDEDGTVKLVIQKLCTILNSPEASPDQQEGVVAALLSLSRHFNQFTTIANSIMTWKPPKPMRITTIEQLNVFFNSRSPDWWLNRKRQQQQQSKLDV